MRMSLLLVAVVSVACHRNRGDTEMPPSKALDGAYSFKLTTNPLFPGMEGQFVVADTQVFLYVERACEPVDAPKSSEGMRAAWFQCGGSLGGTFLQLRISKVDPVNRSRWYARMRVPDTVERCTQYTTRGDCTQGLRAYGMKWVDLYGNMTVVRGMLAPDTSRAPNPPGTRPLRARCDTSATRTSCSGDPRRGT
jgi:hypothetical protein